MGRHQVADHVGERAGPLEMEFAWQGHEIKAQKMDDEELFLACMDARECARLWEEDGKSEIADEYWAEAEAMREEMSKRRRGVSVKCVSQRERVKASRVRARPGEERKW